MPNTSEAMRRAIAKYQEKTELVRFRVPLGKKTEIETIAASKNYESTTAYLIDLIERDSGIIIKQQEKDV